MKTMQKHGWQILLATALCAMLLLTVPTSQPVRAGEPIAVLSNGNFARWFGFPGTPITYRTDQTSPGDKLTQIQFDTNVVAGGFAPWVNVPTANVTVAAGASLGLDVNTGVEFNDQGCAGVNPIVFDNDGQVTDDLLGAGASNGVLGFAGPCFDTSSGQILGGSAVLNGKLIAAGQPIQLLGTAVHEFGHLLGLGHDQTNLNCRNNAPSCTNDSDFLMGVATMFPEALAQTEGGQDFSITLAASDYAAISWLYPEMVNNSPTQIPAASVYGMISGRVVTTDMLSSIQGANVVGRQVDDAGTAGVNESRRCVISTVSGYKYTGNPGLGTFRDETGAVLNPGGGSTGGQTDGSLYGLFEAFLPGSTAPAAGLPPGCTSGTTIGQFFGEVEPIDPDWTDGSSVGPLGRSLLVGASEQLGVPGVALNSVHTESGSITISPGMNFPNSDIVLLNTPPTFDNFDAPGGFSNETPGTAEPLGNGRFRASVSPTDSLGTPPATDVDVFSFVAIANQTVTIETHAKDLTGSSPIDTVIEVVNAAGTRQNLCDTLAAGNFTGPCVNDDIILATDRDSRLNFRSGAGGTFFVRVFDIRGDARADFIYELEITGAQATAPDLSITKSHLGDFTQGQDGTYTITVTNVGTGATPGTTTVTDTLPASLTFVSASGTGWTCNAVGQTVTCTMANSIPVSGSTQIALTVNPSTNVSPVTNTAVVANAGDGNAANNTSNDLTNVNSPGITFNFDGGGNGTEWTDTQNWDPDRVPTTNDTVTIGGTFAVTINGPAAAKDCTINTTQPMSLQSGTFTVSGLCSIATGGFTQTGGTLDGPGTMSVSGAMNWSGGTQTGGGTTTVSSPLNISGTVTLDNRMLNNNGTANMTGGFTTSIQFANNAVFNNTATGTFNANSDGGIIDVGGGGTFNNAGLFSRGVSTQTYVVQNVSFNNTGTVNVLTGGLEIGPVSGTSSGAFSVAMGSQLNFSGTTQTLTGNISGAGTVNLASTTLNLNGGSYNITGTTRFGGNGTTNINSGVNLISVGAVQVDGQTANFSSGETVNATSLSLLNGGTLTGSDAITVSGAFTWTEGIVSGGPGNLTANGGIALTGANPKQLDARTVVNNGAATMSGGATLTFMNNALFNNAATGSFDVQGNVNLSGSGTFTNAGTFSKSTGGGSTSVSPTFTNTGTVNANNGTLAFGPFTQNAGLTRVNGGVLTPVLGMNLNGGVLDGTGVNGDVNNTGGTVRPGTSPGPGILNIVGNYTQGPGGTLEIELAGNGGVPGTDFDNLSITGTGMATLGGTLNVNSLTMGVPSAGSSFQIMNFGTRVMMSDFAVKNDNTGSGLNFISTPGGTDYVVSFLSVGCTKDFDGGGGTGAWETAANWNPDGAPTGADNACIDANSFAVTVSSGAQAANTLVVSGTGNPFTLSGGSLTLAGASSIAGAFNQSGGTLTGAGTLTITGLFTWSTGTQGGAGMTIANGGINIGSGAPSVQRTVVSAGAGTLGGIVNDSATGVFLNLPGATLDITAPDGSSYGAGAGLFNNQGTVTKSSAGTFQFSDNFTNSGTVNINAGVLSLSSTLCTSSGPFNVAATTVLSIAGFPCDMNAGTFITGAGLVTVASDTTNFNTGSSITTAMTLSGGTVNFNAGNTSNLASLTQTGGTLGGDGTVDIAGLFTWSGGTQQGTGTTAANGGMTLSGGGSKSLNNGRTLNNPGAASWTDGDFLIGNGAVFNNQATGTFDIQHPTQRSFGGGLGGGSTVNNAGMMIKTSNNITQVFAGFNNTGTLVINAGNFLLSSGSNPSTSTGNFNVNAGVLQFDPGTYDLNGGAGVSGAGTTTLFGGTVNFNNGSSLTTAVSLISGTLNLSTVGTVALPSLMQSGGTVAGADTLNIVGMFTWSGGDQTGGTTNASGGMTLSGGGSKSLNNGRTLNNPGAATWADGAFLIGNGAVFTNQATGTFDIQHPTQQSFGGGLGGGSTINNAGTMTKSSNVITQVFAGFNNTGTLDINAGNFLLSSGSNPSTSTGNFNVNAGVLQFDPGTYDLNSGAAVSGAGTTTLFGGTANFNNGSSLTTAVSLISGTLTLATGGTVTLPTLTQSGGTLAGADQVNITGAFAWSGGTQQGAGGVTNANGGMTLSTGGQKQLNNGRTLNNPGAAMWTGGDFLIGNGAVFNNLATGTFGIQHGGTQSFGGGLGGASTVNNAGTMTQSAATATEVFAVYNNTGTLSVNSGTLNFNSGFTQTAGSTTLNGGNIGGGILFQFTGGVLNGVGTITGIVNNISAMVSPGLSAGTLTIMGNYVQGAGGTLNIEIDGPAAGQFDVLAISGTATLDGTLNVTGTFMPGAGSSFQVMTYASNAGPTDFTTKHGLNIATPAFIASPQATFYLLTNLADANMGVTKTDAPDPVTEGQSISYTITVNNAGPGTATNVSLMDAVPAGTTFVSLTSPGGWACMTPAVGGTGNVSCSIASLATATPQVFTLVVNTNIGATSPISNTVTVSAAENDPSLADNSATATTTVTPLMANMGVTKTDMTDPVNVGDNVTYTITVTNGGPDPATNASLTDPLPASTTFVSLASPAGWTCMTPAVGATGTVTCTNPTLASGANEVFTLVVATTAASAPSISNTATVAATEADSNAGNNSSTQTTTVNAQIDLAITKADSPDPVIAGNNLTYTLAVMNGGPNDATNVSVTDTLPAGVTFVSASGTGWTCNQAAGVVTCTRPTLAVATAPDITIVVTVTPATRGTLSDTASVTATEMETDPTNDSDTETTTVNASADLAIVKSDSPDPVVINNNVTYTVTVTNNGPSSATNVSVTDTLPMGVTFVSASGTGWTCNQAAGVVTCTVASLAPGAAPAITIVVTAPGAAGTLTNNVSVTATETDPNAANNSASATTTVNAVTADFSLSVDPPSVTIPAGLPAVYTVTAASLGGFAGTVNFTCTGNPELSTCTVEPASVSLTSGSMGVTQVIITTKAGSNGFTAGPVQAPPPLYYDWRILIPGLLLVLSLGTLMFMPGGRRHGRPRMALQLASVVLLCVFAFGCADAGRSTPAGTYTITITGTSGATTHSTTVTLVVR